MMRWLVSLIACLRGGEMWTLGEWLYAEIHARLEAVKRRWEIMQSSGISLRVDRCIFTDVFLCIQGNLREVKERSSWTTLKTEWERSSETSVTIEHSTRRHIPEECNCQIKFWYNYASCHLVLYVSYVGCTVVWTRASSPWEEKDGSGVS